MPGLREGILGRRSHLVVALWVLANGCLGMSEEAGDPTAGLNGGFEVSREGLPVNWLLYTPSDADFDIVLDREVVKEGSQSLRFDVRACSAEGGWKSPGFTNEFDRVGRYPGPARYRLSLWVRNAGTEFALRAGGVSAQEGDMSTLIRQRRDIDEWRLVEFEIDVPDGRWLRMELSIHRPGVLWVDDVRIERVEV
jgi:hypothetical protein